MKHVLHFDICSKQKFVFSMSCNLGYEHAFQPFTYSLKPFFKGGGQTTPTPAAIHKFLKTTFQPAFVSYTERRGDFDHELLIHHPF